MTTAITGVVAVLIFSTIQQLMAVSATVTLTSQTDWEAGEYWNGQLDTSTSAGDLSIASGGVGSWSAETPWFPENLRGRFDLGQEPADIGADLTTDGTYLYMIIGGHQPGLFRYNPETNTWKGLTAAPTELYYGSALTYYNGYLYAAAGHHDGTTATDSSGVLLRYDIAADSWSYLTSAPSAWGRGADLESGNDGKLYAVQGENSTSFWIYTISNDSWADGAPTADPISTLNNHPLVFSDYSFGSSPVYCETGCIYAFVGNSRSFFRYDISLAQWYTGFADVPAAIGNVTTGSAMAFDSANDDLYAFRGGATTFFKYDIGDPGTWDAAITSTENPQRSITNGASLIYLDGYIYGTPGGVPEIMRYDVATPKWDAILTQNAQGTNGSDLIVFIPNGADCADASGCLFVAQGAGTGLRRYDLSTRTWSAALTVIPAALGLGASMCYDGNNTIYIVRGANQTSVYPYSISGNSYGTTIAAPAAIQQGSGIVCPANDRFYVLRGVGTNAFYYYNGTTLAADDNTPAAAVSYGGALGWDGTYVYALAGNLRGTFYRFDPAQGSGSRWSALPDLPTSSYYSASMEYDGAGNFYVIPGKYERDFWRYNVAGQTWSKISDLPQRYGYSHGLAHDDANDVMYILRGAAPSTNAVSIHKFNTETDTYIPSATWISAPQDLNYVSAWEQISATHPTPGTSSISIAMRSSTNEVAWSDWETVVSAATGDSTTQNLSAATTPARRYVQLKVTLTSDNTNTPTLQAVTVTYTKDSTAPTNPTASGWSSSAKTTVISTGNSYIYTNPYFELSGGADAHAGLAGYYVAWATSSSFDPTSSEDYFQTGTTYRLNSGLAAGTTYYLRVAAKDNAGNTAAAATVFQYTYTGISPASSQQWTAQADFEASGTTASNVNTAAGGGTNLTLSSVSGGAWTNEAAAPATIGPGAGIISDNNVTLYILRGTTTQNFYSYNTTTKTYTALANYGANVGAGSSLVFVPNGAACADSGGCIFATRGASTTEFRRYDITAGTWTAAGTLTATSLAAGAGSGLAYGGSNTIYFLAGATAPGTRFYKYSISGNSWTQLADTDQAMAAGGTLVFVPNGTGCSDAGGCLFATRGGNDTDFYRYRINAASWSYMANTPIWVGDGAAMRRVGSYIYLQRGIISNSFYRYDLANNRWDSLASTPTNMYQGSEQGLAYTPGTNTLYSFRGYSLYSLFAYSITNDTWEQTPGLPHHYTQNGFTSGAVAYDTSTNLLYAGRGGTFTDWWRYDPATDIWTQRTDVPHGLSTGADAEYVNHTTDSYDGIYVLAGSEAQGDNVGYFYRYVPATDTWTRLANTTGEPAAGADLVWDGNDTLYTAQGGTTAYYKYVISTNTWSAVASTIPATASTGSCATRINVGGTDYIYLARGGNTTTVYRFNVGTETWDAAATVEVMPTAMNTADACLVDGQGNLLFPRGNSTTDMHVLDPDGDANGVWTTRSVLSAYSNGALVPTLNNVILGFRGLNTSAVDRYVVASATTGYAANGSWTSQIINFGQGAYGYSGLEVNVTNASNASLTIETRTCSDSGCAADPNDSDWGSWTAVSNAHTISSTNYYSIDSTVARYGQARLTFTSDQVFTPTVADVTWKYYTDGTAPSNPTTLTASSQNGGTAITTGNWYNYSGPYFTWSGAADNAGGIGIQGYCVYFGTTADADPASGCTPQTAATYTASSLSTGSTYYLRIKTRDYSGNTSATAWAPFTYSFDNVAPSRPTNVTANPSVPSATNSFAFSWTAGSDSGGSPSFQYCYKRYFSSGNQDPSETCIASSNTSVSGLTALAEGTNYFYVRSKDAAGNFSNNGEYESVAFRYSVTPPTIVPNVSHGAVADPYQHTFSWNEPATHAFDITAYCFQVNAQPSAAYCNNGTYGRWTTTAETSARFLAAFNTSNTQPGTNSFYVVAKDEAGNVDYSPSFNCSTGQGCITFESTTTAPNPPQNPTATDASDRAAGLYRVTIGWRKPADNPGSQLASYRIYRSTDGTTFSVRETVSHTANQNDFAYTDVALSNTTTYYYYIKAVDSAGAESMATSTLSVKPEGKFTTPPGLIGNPSMQPRIRSALIQWLTDEPDTHPASSFVRYGTASGVYTGEQGTSDLTGSHSVTLIDLSPGTIYYIKLKWVDVDGNIGQSPEYSLTTNGAPSAPRNLTVSPAFSTANRFAFDWDAPTDEGVTVAGYFYSVNSVPTKDNTSYITASTVGPIAAATQQGVNTFYVVAVDDAGNVSYANYTSIEFEVQTPPPGSPQNINIVDSSDRDAKRYNITLTWDPPENVVASGGEVHANEVSADEVTYTIYRSIDTDQNFEQIARIISTGYLDTGLDNTKKYFYKVTAADSAGASSNATTPIAEVPEGRFTQPPAITEAPTASPDSYSVTIAWRTERAASSFVEYGNLQDQLSEEQGTAELVEPHSVKVTGLTPEITYFYRIKSIDVDENVAQSDVLTFTTLEAPKVSNVEIGDIRLRDAIISWETNKESTATIIYGTTPNFGQTFTDTSGSYAFTHTVKLENLADGTTYHLRITGQDRNTNPIVSDAYTFTTLTFPQIADIATKNKGEGQTDVTWKTNVPTTSVVEYYGETISPKTQGNAALTTEHSILLFGLEDATLYKFKVHGADQFGYEAVSPEQEFTTLEDTTPPEVFGVTSESNTIGAGEASKIQIIVSWKTNEPTTSRVEYGVGLSGGDFTDTTEEGGELVLDHLVVISDLSPAKTYHFRVVSRDKAGNETKSGSYSVLTSRKRESFLQLIISNIEETFSWVGNLRGIF
ncbi:MAG: fibronectin type III domain-containing protein [Candidatus Kerfeldbacteria bacterium]|nr:fibronectin type III domain-containing protein [Candidatus Kerfeldbacteria bacterium]